VIAAFGPDPTPVIAVMRAIIGMASSLAVALAFFYAIERHFLVSGKKSRSVGQQQDEQSTWNSVFPARIA
jgi:hypothetical protein